MAEVRATEPVENVERWFDELGYVTETYTAGDMVAEFRLRPMRSKERVRHNAGKEIYNNSMQWTRAFELARVNPESLLVACVAKELGKPADSEEVLSSVDAAYNKVKVHVVIDPDACAEWDDVKSRTALSCVESVTIGGETRPYTQTMWDRLPAQVQGWLIGRIEHHSKLTGAEILGL